MNINIPAKQQPSAAPQPAGASGKPAPANIASNTAQNTTPNATPNAAPADQTVNQPQPQQPAGGNGQPAAAKQAADATQPAADNTAAKPEPSQSKPLDSQAATAASKVDITTKDVVSHKLAELAKAVETRANLIASLPEDIQKAVKDIIRQTALTENNLPAGLASLLKSQNAASKQVAMLASLLEDAGKLTSDGKALNNLAQLLGKLFTANNQANQNTTAQPNAGQSPAESASKPAGQNMPQAQVSQPVQKGAQLPPELAKLAETIKQPDLALLWKTLQTNNPENKSLPLTQAQQKLFDLAGQMAKGEMSPNSIQQALRQIISETPGLAKLLEQNQTSNALPKQPGNSPSPAQSQPMQPQTTQEATLAKQPPQTQQETLLAKQTSQLPPETKIPEPPLPNNQAPLNAGSRQLAPSLTLPGGGGNFNIAFSIRLEQNLSQVASNLLTGNMTLEEARTALDNLLKSSKGLDMAKLSQLDSGLDKQAANLLKQTMSNIPPQIEHAAARYNLPELKQAWILTQTAKLEQYLGRLPEELKQAAGNLRSLAAVMQRATSAPVAEHQGGNSTFSFTTAFNFGGGQTYPAHIHIYQESFTEGTGRNQRRKPETWMRIALDTENIGTVDTFFRLYEKNKLDIRVRFQDPQTAREFGGYLPQIRQAMHKSPLELTDISVRSAIKN